MSALAKATTRKHLTLILILVGMMATPTVGADAASSAVDPGPRFKVESDVVRVPVVVIDKEGRLYTDLKKEQFKILEDGVEQPGDFLHRRGGTHEHRLAAGIQQTHSSRCWGR